MTTATHVRLDVATVREAFTAALADRGEGYVYRSPEGGSCLYWHDPRDAEAVFDQTYLVSRGDQGHPGCLVGYVLHHAGVPARALACREQRDALSLVDELEIAGLLVSDRHARTLLQCAQSEQDDGTEWGTAVAIAEDRLAEATRHGD